MFDGVTDEVAIAFANSTCPDAGCHFEAAGYASLLDLLQTIGAINAVAHARLLAYDGTDAADEARQASLAFRDVTVAVLDALRNREPIPESLLTRVDAELAHCHCTRTIVRDGSTFRNSMRFEIEQPHDILAPLAHSVANILTTADASRIKQCREPRCSCYFIDTSKNRTRTWCSMQRCGNRQKVANYYRRTRDTTAIDVSKAI